MTWRPARSKQFPWAWALAALFVAGAVAFGMIWDRMGVVWDRMGVVWPN